MQIANQAITIITKACYLMQIRALAMSFGTCPVSQPECKGSADRLAQHDLHITKQVSNRGYLRGVWSPYRVEEKEVTHPSIPDQARCTSSRPDTILVTPCPATQVDHPLPPHIGCSAV
eukprot:1160841-Pelagomonas_calceolata.AAC.1